ncbi:unannotated protein [freshwater metagenome]|uniref:Unannotated protein n=1 Tax=freshwater metagenome TaxID=449393 RepID=A0A6J7VNZ8_9ZZZZ
MFFGNFPGAVVTRDTSIGDNDIEATEAVDTFGHGRIKRSLIANIGHMGDDPAAFLLDHSGGLVQVFLGCCFVGDIGKDRCAGIDGDDVGALGGEPAGMGPTLPTSRSGNQYDLALKAAFIPAHVSPSVNVFLFPTT